jgi:hypothetical protein
VVARVRVPAVHDVVSCPESEYPELHTGSQLSPDASSVRSAHVPAAALSGFVSFGYVAAVHAFAAHVARVRVPAVHDVVICPDSEYPELHTGSQLAPDASSVSPAHDPASALSGFVSFGYVSAVHAFAAHVESVTSPAAEHDVGPDSVYPLAHTGVHDVPAASVPFSQLPSPVPRVGFPVPVSKDTAHDPTDPNEQTTFVSVPLTQVATVVNPITYSGVLHVGLQVFPLAILSPLLPFDATAPDEKQSPSPPLVGVTQAHQLCARATLAPHMRRATAKCLAHGFSPPRNMRVCFWRPPSPRSRRRARAIAVPGGKGTSRDITRSREGETRACADFATMGVSPREHRRRDVGRWASLPNFSWMTNM